MKRRDLVLIFSAIIITALCVYRLYLAPEGAALRDGERTFQRAALPFELFDENNRRVRLTTYLGRHRILLVFFDGTQPVTADPALSFLVENSDRLEKESIIVLAISEQLPQDNRKTIIAEDGYPFSILSDPGFQVQEQWGVFDRQTQGTKPAVFLIDRKGAVIWDIDEGTPLPLADPLTEIKELLQ